MKAKVLLRIAAIIMLLHTVGHSIGALTWKKAPNAAIAKLIYGMLHDRFNFMGSSLTLGSFYQGYGLIMIAVLLFLSMLIWTTSYITGPHTQIVIVLISLLLAVLAIIEWIYFFPFAAIMSSAAAVLAFLACFFIRRTISMDKSFPV